MLSLKNIVSFFTLTLLVTITSSLYPRNIKRVKAPVNLEQDTLDTVPCQELSKQIHHIINNSTQTNQNQRELLDQYYFLHDAAYKNCSKTVTELLDLGINSNKRAPETFDTPLIAAIEAGNYLIAQQLISNGALPDLKNRAGNNALALAVFKNDLELVKLLIEKGGATINTTAGIAGAILHEPRQHNQPKRFHPLFSFIIATGNHELFTYFINKGASVNSITSYTENYLATALAHNKLSMAQALIEHGASISPQELTALKEDITNKEHHYRHPQKSLHCIEVAQKAVKKLIDSNSPTDQLYSVLEAEELLRDYFPGYRNFYNEYHWQPPQERCESARYRVIMDELIRVIKEGNGEYTQQVIEFFPFLSTDSLYKIEQELQHKAHEYSDETITLRLRELGHMKDFMRTIITTSTIEPSTPIRALLALGIAGITAGTCCFWYFHRTLSPDKKFL